jgi:PAS domain S-box-containing protein
VPAEESRQLRIAQINQLYSLARPGLAGALLSVFILALALRPVVSHSALMIWVGCYVAAQAPRYWLVLAFERRHPVGEVTLGWGKWFIVTTVISGVIWGTAGVFLFPENSSVHQVMLAISLAGIASAAAGVYAPLKECYIPTVLAVLLPLAGTYFSRTDETNYIMGTVILVFAAVLLRVGGIMHRTNAQSLLLRFEKNDLIDSLTAQKNKVEQLNATLSAEIEERKNVEAALRKSEERLDLALRGADLGLWDCDLGTGAFFFNDRWADMIGYTLEDIRPGLTGWTDLIHPDDKAGFSAAWHGHLEGSIPAFEAELRLRMKTEGWKWVLSSGKVVDRDESGKPLRMSGTHLDINDRKIAEAAIKGSLAEKELLLREIHHRVKNNLQIMSSLMRLHARHVDDEKYKANFREAESRILSMALVHEKLYQSENLAGLALRHYLQRVLRHLMTTYEMDGRRIALDLDIEDIIVGVDVAIPIGFIVTEVFSNCIKHAFPGGRDGQILVGFQLMEGDISRLIVRDNGIGIPVEFSVENGKTMGLRLVHIFVNQLGGRLDIISDEGTEFRMTFKGKGVIRGGSPF